MTAYNRHGFPVIECNYQPMILGGFRGQCPKPAAPSFRNISQQYFQNDARRDFIGEVFFFAVIVATTVAPLLSAASALSDLCRVFGQL